MVFLGLHASISVHLSERFYNRQLGRWESNFAMFHERVGKFPERIQNMYLTYTLLLRAILKIKRKIESVQLGVHEVEDARAKNLMKALFKSLPKFSKNFDANLFAINPDKYDYLKAIFRNMAKLMDCVSCERCRLWGKVQIYGVGTALKILTSSNPKYKYFISAPFNFILVILNLLEANSLLYLMLLEDFLNRS